MLRQMLRAVVACSLLGAGVIHAARAPSHFGEWWAAGVTAVALAGAKASSGPPPAGGRIGGCGCWPRR